MRVEIHAAAAPHLANELAALPELAPVDGISPFGLAIGGGVVQVDVDLERTAAKEDAIRAKVEQAVAAHDPLADPGKAVRDNEAAILLRLEEAIAKLEEAGAGWPDLTAAKKDAATRLAVRTVAKLARLQLRRLDSIE